MPRPQQVGPLQLVYCGKAHRGDTAGKALIRQVWEAGRALQDAVKVVYVENHEMRWAQYLTSGADLWLNTPNRPQENQRHEGRSQRSPQLQRARRMVDGRPRGRSHLLVDQGRQDGGDDAQDAASLYDKLERIVLPMFYGQPSVYADVT
ncbi:MAG: hypothetical protein HYR60_14950 [Acidobacteria bacterium]|nr:hypothetical protein [Acidobacteriota bacterium]